MLIDLVVHAVKSQHRQVKVVKFPADIADPQSPKSLQSVLLENMQSFSRSAQHMLFLLPWNTEVVSVVQAFQTLPSYTPSVHIGIHILLCIICSNIIFWRDVTNSTH